MRRVIPLAALALVIATVLVPTLARAQSESGGSFVPVAIVGIVFGCGALIVGIVAYAAHRGRQLRHETIRLAIEKGQPVPPELLGAPTAGTRRRDLKRGLVLVFVGAAICISFAVSPPSGMQSQWVAGLVPAALGLAFLTSYALGRRDPQAPGEDR
jgi:hypothetical protein